MAKKKIITKAPDTDPFLLKGNTALLLAEACKLDKQRKDAEKRLKEIKKELAESISKEGTYSNSAGDRVGLTFRDYYTDIDPKEVYNKMKEKKIGKYFWKCVKVALTETKKFLNEKEISQLREELEPIKVFSFK